MMIALDAGADDLADEGDSWEITTPYAEVGTVAEALRAKGIEPASAEVAKLPKTTVRLDRTSAAAVIRLVDNLEDLDDVQRVSAIFDIPDEILEELGSD